MKKELTVLVTACGAQFMPGLARCLRDNGERAIRIIGVDRNVDQTVLQMVDRCYQVPGADDPAYVDALLEVCEKEGVDVLLPFMSADLLPLIDNQARFEAVHTILSVSGRESVKTAIDKLALYRFMEKSGVPVPQFAPVDTADDLLPACRAVGYPERAVCVKAVNLSGSRGVRIIDPSVSRYDLLFREKPTSMYTTMEELQVALRERDAIPQMMAMEFLPGLEGSVDLIADKGRVLYSAYRESNVNLASIPQEAIIVENAEACEVANTVANLIEIDGNADLDFKNDKYGHPVLMEVNPRLGATVQIFSEGGLNLPYLRIKQLLGEKLPPVHVRYGVRMKRRYLEMFDQGGVDSV